MNILKSVLSVGAGLLAAASCYFLMGGSKKSDDNETESESQVNNQMAGSMGQSESPNANCTNSAPAKSDCLLIKLDRFQVGLINFARFISEVVRAISLFIRATKCYEYDVSLNNGYQKY